MIKNVENLSNEISSIDEMQREIRSLKRKLALAEANLTRARLISSAQERIESILSDSLKKEIQFFKLVLENATNILLLLDFDGRFAYASNTFLADADIANFGLIHGRHFHDVLKPLISEESLRKFTASMELAAVQKNTINLEEEIDFNFKGSPRLFSILVTPMTGDNGESIGIMALFNDITEINNALETANRASVAKSEFLANMSHEIRTPLNAVIGMAAIAQESDDIGKIKYCLNKINDSSTHLLGVINDILDMSKIETNHFELSYSQFVFEKMLLRVADVMRFKLEEKNIDFTYYCDPQIPYRIFSDEQRLSQVIMNLLSNAIKFTPEKGRVEIRAEVESAQGDDYVLCISVKDSGIGISEEQRPRLFKVFSQADSSISRKFGGTGLGLVISKNIINLLGGDIWFDSTEGQGTTFAFNIKTRSYHLEPGMEPSCEDDKMAEQNDVDDFSGKTILLVDDIEINREIIISLLEDTGIDIVCAENGKEAVEKYIAAADLFDLIFMDVQMPEMDGYEATKIIRASTDKVTSPVPIIAMTANVFKEDIEQCLVSGMNDHIGKPVSFQEIMMKLKQWLKKT